MVERRKKKRKYVQVRKRVVTYRTVTKQVWQCERPYVLFGKAIRDARYALEWNQQDLADKMKLSRGSIANIETGRQRILLTDLFDFARVLRVKPIVFFNAVAK